MFAVVDDVPVVVFGADVGVVSCSSHFNLKNSTICSLSASIVYPNDMGSMRFGVSLLLSHSIHFPVADSGPSDAADAEFLVVLQLRC